MRKLRKRKTESSLAENSGKRKRNYSGESVSSRENKKAKKVVVVGSTKDKALTYNEIEELSTIPEIVNDFNFASTFSSSGRMAGQIKAVL